MILSRNQSAMILGDGRMDDGGPVSKDFSEKFFGFVFSPNTFANIPQFLNFSISSYFLNLSFKKVEK